MKTRHGSSGSTNLRLPPDFSDDNADVRMKKFAESLMRQRQLREQELARQERRSRSRDKQERRSRSRDRQERRSISRDRQERRSRSRDRQERRSNSRDRLERRSRSRDRLERRSNSRDRLERRSSSRDRMERRSSSRDRLKRRSSSRERQERRSRDRDDFERRIREQGAYSLPVISSRNSDKSNSEITPSPEKSRKLKKKYKMRRSSSLTEFSELVWDKDASKRSLSINQLSNKLLQCSGPSSSSSCGTVISKTKQGTAASGSRYLEQEPLPSHLEDIQIETDRQMARSFNRQSSKLSNQSRQSSKRSISNSFETVIANERCFSSEKDSIDTEDEGRNLFAENGRELPERRLREARTAWTDKSSEERELVVNNVLTRPVNSGNSSLPSTSDEDNERRRRLERRELSGDTSTMESVQMIDRAKSFEYIPGESFPLQENSSSYEYLPGLVNP